MKKNLEEKIINIYKRIENFIITNDNRCKLYELEKKQQIILRERLGHTGAMSQLYLTVMIAQ